MIEKKQEKREKEKEQEELANFTRKFGRSAQEGESKDF